MPLGFAVLFGVVLALTLTGETHAVDFDVLDKVREHRTDAQVASFKAVSLLGNKYVLVVLVALLGAYGWFRNRRIEALLLVAGAAATAAIGIALKLVIGRARPTAWFAEGVEKTSGAFPSGHALLSAFLFTFLALVVAHIDRRPAIRWLAGIVGVTLPLLIAVSRVVLGVHHPSDVVAGWALGLALALHTYAVYVGLDAAAQDTTSPSERK